MHPPFYVVDHKIGQAQPHAALAHEEKRIIRRNRPEALRLTLPPPGLPLTVYTPVRAGSSVYVSVVRRWFRRLFRHSKPDPAGPVSAGE